MECRHATYRVNCKIGQPDGGAWYCAECDTCGAVTEWCLTADEAKARMRNGDRWVSGEEDGNESQGQERIS